MMFFRKYIGESIERKEKVEEGDGAEGETAKEWQRKTGTARRRRRKIIAESLGNPPMSEGSATCQRTKIKKKERRREESKGEIKNIEKPK